MKNIDLQPDRERFYIQTNNEIDPYISCQVTSMVMGLDIGGFGLNPVDNIICKYNQPEDKLRHYMLTDPVVQDHWRRYYNTSIPAPEWAGVMVFAINRLYNKKVVYFDEILNTQEIYDDLEKGLPIYICMHYPENRNFSGQLVPIGGHIVLIVGCTDNGNIIISDPYKNHLTGEADGFKNIYTPEQYKYHSKHYAIRYQK